ncbi:transposase [Slackia exigua]|uniref:transposase n=1 Tax=Slackia exigua TaxID=84109 RepID=UPI003AB9A60C
MGDMTRMPTREGRLCLAAAIDAFSRKAVGRPMPDRIAGKVAVDAIEQAAGREDPPDDGSLVFHVGQGVRYASKAFRRCLGSHGMTQPASGPGTPSGDAAAESFFKTLKRELAEERRHEAREEAKQDIFKHVGPCCNRVRMHSYPGYMPPR